MGRPGGRSLGFLRDLVSRMVDEVAADDDADESP